MTDQGSRTIGSPTTIARTTTIVKTTTIARTTTVARTTVAIILSAVRIEVRDHIAITMKR